MNKKYWPLAIQAAAYILNRTPHTSLKNLSPFEESTGDKPDLTRTRVFGCKAYVQVPKAQRRGKLSETAWEGTMVGYSTSSPEWIILDPRSGRLRTVYSVTFDEQETGNESETWRNREHQDETNTTMQMEADSPTTVQRVQTPPHGQKGKEQDRGKAQSFAERASQTGVPEHIELKAQPRGTRPPNRPEPSVDATHDKPSCGEDGNGEASMPNNQHLRRGTRIRQRFDPGHMTSGTLEMETLRRQIEEDPPQDEGQSPSAADDEHENPTSLGLCMALLAEEDSVPRTWRQALHIPQWKQAMVNEKQELEAKGAWDLVPKPQHQAVLPGLWRYRIKRDEKGTIVKHKARWCADGSRESFQRSPEAKYSPVAELSTARTIFAIAAANRQTVLQADFPNAYLNADLQEEVYVVHQKGLEEPGMENHVCHLKKALYGTSISGRVWHDTLKTSVGKLGYAQSKIDHCLFFRSKEGMREILTMYVDDILVTSSGGTENAEAQLDELAKLHEVKKLGAATFMLGVGVHQEENKTVLEQRSYVESILRETDFLDAKPRSTPWDSHFLDDGVPLEKAHAVIYRKVVGQLMYLSTVTRPDIAFAVGRLAAGFREPTKGLWERAMRVLRYLNGSKGASIKYGGVGGNLRLETYVDASYAVDPVRRRSVTGYVICLGGGPVLWRSHLQSTVADSPNAAEYIGMYEAVVATMGVKNLLAELGVDLPTPVIYEDNDGVIRLAMSGMGQKKARHLDVKHHLVQDMCRKGEIQVLRLPGVDQPADLLTKGSHTAESHSFLRGKLGVVIST
ncbi:MAG: hypothetical protein GY753_01340 [Gammaproteobacteria bacterium]|nr:hypothetical protein [Gammaproteobacteria bacterium]